MAAAVSAPSEVLNCRRGEVISCEESLSNRLSAQILPREDSDLMKVITVCRDLLTPVVSIHYAAWIAFPHHESAFLEALLSDPHADQALEKEVTLPLNEG